MKKIIEVVTLPLTPESRAHLLSEILHPSDGAPLITPEAAIEFLDNL